jgi:hypothetical protein
MKEPDSTFQNMHGEFWAAWADAEGLHLVSSETDWAVVVVSWADAFKARIQHRWRLGRSMGWSLRGLGILLGPEELLWIMACIEASKLRFPERKAGAS